MPQCFTKTRDCQLFADVLGVGRLVAELAPHTLPLASCHTLALVAYLAWLGMTWHGTPFTACRTFLTSTYGTGPLSLYTGVYSQPRAFGNGRHSRRVVLDASPQAFLDTV